MSLFSPAKKTTRQKLRIIQFGSADWGFTDSSMPKVSSILAKLEEEDVQVWHNGFTLKFRGEKKKEAFERTKALLEESLSLPEFDGFKIGVAEGESENFIDDGKIAMEALKRRDEEKA